jgi:putative SOS response-associated peptidase YedK
MALTKLLPVAGIVAFWAASISTAQPPAAPAPRPVEPQIDNLIFRYRDMRVMTPAEFDAWVDSMDAERLPDLLASLRAQRAEIERREAAIRQRLNTKGHVPNAVKQK